MKAHCCYQNAKIRCSCLFFLVFCFLFPGLGIHVKHLSLLQEEETEFTALRPVEKNTLEMSFSRWMCQISDLMCQRRSSTVGQTAPTVWSKELWNACFLPRIVRLHPAWWSRCIKRQVLSGFCSVCLVEGRQNYPELHKPEPASPGKAATPDIDWVMHQGLSPVPLSLRLRLPACLTAPDSPSARNVKRSIRITAAGERDLRDDVVEAAAACWPLKMVWGVFLDFFLRFFYFQLVCLSLHWSKTTMVRKTQLTGFRQPHLMAGQGVGGRDRRGARHLSNCVSVTDPSTTLPLEPVENNLFFLTVSGRIHLQIGWRRGCFFFVLFFGFPCRTFQFSLLVKPRRSRHLVLWFDLWRRGSGGGRGGMGGAGGWLVRGCGGKNSERRLLSAATVPRWRRK